MLGFDMQLCSGRHGADGDSSLRRDGVRLFPR